MKKTFFVIVTIVFCVFATKTQANQKPLRYHYEPAANNQTMIVWEYAGQAVPHPDALTGAQAAVALNRGHVDLQTKANWPEPTSLLFENLSRKYDRHFKKNNIWYVTHYNEVFPYWKTFALLGVMFAIAVVTSILIRHIWLWLSIALVSLFIMGVVWATNAQVVMNCRPGMILENYGFFIYLMLFIAAGLGYAVVFFTRLLIKKLKERREAKDNVEEAEVLHDEQPIVHT